MSEAMRSQCQENVVHSSQKQGEASCQTAGTVPLIVELRLTWFVASYLGVVGGLLDNLWSHPEWRPNKRFPLDLRIRQLTGHTEVRQFHLAVL